MRSKPPGLNAFFNREYALARVGTHELKKDSGNQVKFCGRPIPRKDIRHVRPNRDTAVLCEFTCLNDTFWREVESLDVKSLFCEPDAVAAPPSATDNCLPSWFQ